MSLYKFGVTATFLTLALLSSTAFATSSTKTTSKHASTAKSASHHSSTHRTSAKNSKHSSKKKVSARSHGQRGIGEERTREIQSALIREHYLSGDATGTWDSESKDAMMRYQQANGWQTKMMPDSRALIKLGLGPDHKDLL